jgi:hypothetical protein
MPCTFVVVLPLTFVVVSCRLFTCQPLVHCAGVSLRDSRYKPLGLLHKVMTTTRSVNVRSPVFSDGVIEFPKTGSTIAPQVGSHGDAVLCIVVSPDGTKAATGTVP